MAVRVGRPAVCFDSSLFWSFSSSFELVGWKRKSLISPSELVIRKRESGGINSELVLS